MQKAYILVETEVGQAEDVARRAASLEQVLAVEVVTGPYDVVVLAEGRSIHLLHDGVFRRIDADLRVTRAVMCPVGGPAPFARPKRIEPEPLPIEEPEPVLIGPRTIGVFLGEDDAAG